MRDDREEGRRGARTVMLSQLIHRGMIMLVRVIAQAVRRSVVSFCARFELSETITSQEGYQRGAVDEASCHCGRA